jgi:hypothetical protein
MSWLFSQALVEASSEASSLDGRPSAPSNTMPTPQAFLSRDKTTDAWSRFPSGMTCEPLTEKRGEELLTWFRAVFLAKTLARPAKARASTESEAGCGGTWSALLAKFDQDSRSWKTAHFLPLEDLDAFSETWPKWGMMLDGECWELPTPGHHTFAHEYGSWPTPVKTDGFAVGWCLTSIGRKERGEKRPSGAHIGSGLKYFRKTGQFLVNGYPSPILTEWLMGWPTKWTGLHALATDKFQQWQLSHGVSLAAQEHTTQHND